MMVMFTILSLGILPLVSADVAAWHKGMYCVNGTKAGVNDENNNAPVKPLFQLKRSEWWMQAVTNCVNFPPADGDFLDLPANGEFATNRAFTSLSFNGQRATTFVGPLADNVTDDTFGVCGGNTGRPCDCITQPNLHAQNETSAAGTAFAIAYNPNPMDVKPEELVVFSVAEHTPWRRLTTYQVPNLPKCPDAGCTCVWGWVPNGCGEPDIYMQPFRCRVTGNPGSTPPSPAKPPVYCSANPSSCTSGAKQMIFWNQAEGNNVEGTASPGYNTGMGWAAGRQTDIFTSTNNTGTSDSGNGNGNTTPSSHKGGISSGAIAGIVVGIIALLITLALVFYFCVYRHRRNHRDENGEQQRTPKNESEIIEPFVATLESGTRATSMGSLSADPASPGLPPLRPGTHRKNISQTLTTSSTEPFSPSESRNSSSVSPSSSSSGRAPAGTKLQRERERQMAVEQPILREEPQEAHVPERHVDGGPVEGSMLERRGSGRLPPAYGDISR